MKTTLALLLLTGALYGADPVCDDAHTLNTTVGELGVLQLPHLSTNEVQDPKLPAGMVVVGRKPLPTMTLSDGNKVEIDTIGILSDKVGSYFFDIVITDKGTGKIVKRDTFHTVVAAKGAPGSDLPDNR
jgi:hypothetical protein